MSVWEGGVVALAYAPRAEVAPAAAATRPAVDPRSGRAAVLSGTVHDWGAGGPRAGVVDDAAGLLDAYEAGGEPALERAVGDFTAALWDPGDRRLVLVSGGGSGAGLLWVRRSGRLRFASTIEQLLAGHDALDEIDEDAVAWTLYAAGRELSEHTFFAPVRRLSGGRILVARSGAVTVRSYRRWPDRPPPDRPVTPADVASFRELFLEAVRCRLPVTGPPAVLASGGVDSCAVACAAAAVSESPTLYTASFEHHPEQDERRYLDDVAALHGLRVVAEPADDACTLSDLERWLPACAEPFFAPYDATTEAAIAHAHRDGVRVLLWGHGGDSLLSGSSRHLAGQVLRGRWRQVVREARAEVADTGTPAIRELAASAVFPLLPRAIQARELRRHAEWTEDWIPPRLAARARELVSPWVSSGPDAWWHELRHLMTRVGDSPAAGYLDRRARFEGVEYRTPFFDRRLVDAVLRLPPQAVRSGGLTKVILREALGDDLPHSVRRRRDKVVLTPLYDEGLRRRRAALMRELGRDSELARREWVAERPWRDALDRYLDGDDRPRFALWNSIVLELWLRRREGRL